jgi:3-deoxy-7-phosphoheptulonate synthase
MANGLLVKEKAGRTIAVEITPGVRAGSSPPLIIAGPCAVESPSQIMEVACAVRAAGAQVLRGGAFKPRTSPYSFQGLGEQGLVFLKAAGEAVGMPVVTEVMEVSDILLVAEYADVLQVGSRNMHNTALLKKLGGLHKPILLKRGMAATLDEWLFAAEYILTGGNDRIILCERGIRTFETYTRNTLDLGCAVAAKQLTHLPVIADPSHGSGRRELVAPLSRAALAAGLDGIMVEVHVRPDEALSDREQTLAVGEFQQLMQELGLFRGV